MKLVVIAIHKIDIFLKRYLQHSLSSPDTHVIMLDDFCGRNIRSIEDYLPMVKSSNTTDIINLFAQVTQEELLINPDYTEFVPVTEFNLTQSGVDTKEPTQRLIEVLSAKDFLPSQKLKFITLQNIEEELQPNEIPTHLILTGSGTGNLDTKLQVLNEFAQGKNSELAKLVCASKMGGQATLPLPGVTGRSYSDTSVLNVSMFNPPLAINVRAISMNEDYTRGTRLNYVTELGYISESEQAATLTLPENLQFEKVRAYSENSASSLSLTRQTTDNYYLPERDRQTSSPVERMPVYPMNGLLFGLSAEEVNTRLMEKLEVGDLESGVGNKL